MYDDILKAVRFPIYEGHSYLVTYTTASDEKWGMYVMAIDSNDAIDKVLAMVPEPIQNLKAIRETPTPDRKFN